MYFIIKRLFELRYITPFYEYGIHFLLHKYKSNTHKTHHKEFFNNDIKFEYWLFPLIGLFYYFENYHLTLGISQYLFIHTITHKYPQLLPKHLKHHHELHHLNKKYNFGVSSKLPDYVFGTLF
tara:strand:- start:3502 stop:3870 length:369 start_codon:yes stop_codon:yes gene_type:complete